MKRFASKYGGIIIGSILGLILRIFFDIDFKDIVFEFSGLYSLTFLWIVPIIIGITPLVFASKEQLGKESYRIGSPVLTVFLFFCICYITRLEDIFCLIIMSVPFLFGAAIAGVLFGELILRYRKRRGIMYSVFLIPLFTGFAEEQFRTPEKIYEIQTTFLINSSQEIIWENIVRVNKIKEEEYSKGFFNYIGIPRPLFAELDKDTIGATRTGHFEGGLCFKEKVTSWERNKKVSFDIEVVPGSIRQSIFDQHILKGSHFRFINASYELKPITENQTELTLTSSYLLNTKVNYYGALWGNLLLTDFQERLLSVIKKRCDT